MSASIGPLLVLTSSTYTRISLMVPLSALITASFFLTTDLHSATVKALPFRHNNFWASYEQASVLVKIAWHSSSHGTYTFRLARKLKCTKTLLKEWYKQHIGHPFDRLQRNYLKLNYVESKLCLNPNSYRLNS